MEKLCALIVASLIFGPPFATRATALRSRDGLEEWGYVEVRPKAHMFWWLYRSPNREKNASKPWPIILWLQGGPGASGAGYGNFEEIGPLDVNLKPRDSTWLRIADLLFVDNPVGTGFSFVEHPKLLAKTDEEAATDLTTLLIKIFKKNKSHRKSHLYIVGESYGGKFVVTLGLSALKAIEAGKLRLKLGGVALGNSWISPEDFVLSWGPLLKDVSRLDDYGLRRSNSIARKIKRQLQDGQFFNATNSWLDLEGEISYSSYGVSMYNFLLDEEDSGVLSGIEARSPQRTVRKRYSSYLKALRSSTGGGGDVGSLLNGAVRRKLKIIPENVTWQLLADPVTHRFDGDFMKPRIDEVDELLAKGVHVTVFNGQLDVICATKGVEAWIRKLKWEGLPKFLGKERELLTGRCGSDKNISKGFLKSHKNLHFYWILGAGHMVPKDQPCMGLIVASAITHP
ncbi:serine carboxypeptidase-like 51 [Prosopis cineraria]|uniref:serine carboxypeptidase-like 51 n=1 Tax=Prosopis cineraria TaxID=364024 RepID=UPI00240F0917|nr:serine carboxypeptidase-like 51 [Prosopis cineraria]